ncbi:MAG: bifunctional 2-C-methyl-D-erythritol 4-phosphate cytidylyltransferase/2-C-methyl-D-erythritol 2,4-cyclodiphosphate synthase [Sphingomonadales bacterium]|nr:bifunctional 2-C-methyl-D-erythritol 4-phosphate cytidylyltransferase/2-C-methyl-D-erythritol 2,4-cyclodiphosphate synthase [Sphingomonadales bacterium]
MAEAPRISALIVAAGKGERVGGGVPKQYRKIRGKSVLRRAIEPLWRHDAIGEIRIVIGEGQEPLYEQAIEGMTLPSPVLGGATRQQSVRNGIEAIAADGGADILLIHDAARPFLPAEVIDRLLEACDSHDGAIPAIAVTDSLARIDGSTVPRSEFVQVQTPQAFRFDAILSAHRDWAGGTTATDDGEIARAAGYDIVLVDGSKALKKLTFEDDFMGYGGIPDIRTGIGFDVHAFAAGDHVWLGGIRIPHDRGLAGHSDADVALHALTDAILGALGEGDIGTHFPPSDAQWKDAASSVFLARAGAIAAEHGLSFGNLDVTIICEDPRIGPHREAMRDRIAEILEIDRSCVNVKGTTTERLGFTGRAEGIAAQAVATLRASS